MALSSPTSLNEILDELFDMFFGDGFTDRESYRASVQNIYQVPYYYYLQVRRRGAVPANDTEPLSIDAITWCYRLFLLREPESIDVVMRYLADFQSRSAAFAKFLFSTEFSATQIRQLKRAFPDAERILLVHIPKTAGTSLREWVFDRIGNRVCVHDMKDVTRRFPLDFERAKQQLIVSGHQPWPVWVAEPRDKVFCILREPVARAVSFYKYICKLAANPDPREIAFFEQLLDRSFVDLTQTTDWLPSSEQCRYLSSEGTFQAVIANTKVFDISLSTIDKLPALARKLAAAVGFDYSELPRFNHTDDIAFPEYSVDDLTQFHENNKEDFLLFMYMNALERRAAEWERAGKSPEPRAAVPAEAGAAIEVGDSMEPAVPPRKSAVLH